MMGTTMKPAEIGPGEAASRARSRRILVNFIALGAVGGVVGFTAAMVELPHAPLNAGGTLPAWFAILAVVVLVGAIAVGNFFYYRSMDEVQRLDNYWATAVGANVLLISYPVWLLLWKGGLSPSPDAFLLYIAMFAATTLAYIWRKLR